MDLLEKKAFEKANKNIVRHPWELARELILIKNIQKTIGNKNNFEVFDIGCGDGFNISSVASLFPNGNFQGIDIELLPTEIKNMNEKSPTNLKFYSNIDEAKLVNNIDGFVLMDVLEHVEYPIELLQSLKQKTNSNNKSIFIITVPAWQFLFSPHDLFLKHFRRYTINTLKETTKDANLKPIEFHYFFFTLFIVRLIKKIILSILNKKEEITQTNLVWNYGQTSAKIVTQILYFEYKIMRMLSKVGINLPGLSVFGMCSN